MCVPLGHGRRSHSGSIKTKISKPDVEFIISRKTYDICQWRRSGCSDYEDCTLSAEELTAALNDEATSVSVANTSRVEYKRGYRTVVMVAPAIQAKVLLRTRK